MQYSPVLVLAWAGAAMKQATQQSLAQEHGWSEPGWNDSAPFAGASISVFSSCCGWSTSS